MPRIFKVFATVLNHINPRERLHLHGFRSSGKAARVCRSSVYSMLCLQRTAFYILQGLMSTWINSGSRTCDICIWGMILDRVKVNNLLGSGWDPSSP